MLEHVPDDDAFAGELARVTRPGGRLVVNTPHLKRTALRRLRHALGQTDEKHGHLRPGYAPDACAGSWGPVRSRAHRTYSRFFSEAVDTALNWGIDRLGKKASAKGMVVTGDDLARNRKAFRAYSAIYPLCGRCRASTRSSPPLDTCWSPRCVAERLDPPREPQRDPRGGELVPRDPERVAGAAAGVGQPGDGHDDNRGEVRIG